MIIEIESIYSFHQLGERDNQEDSRYPDVDAPSTGEASFVVCDGVGGCNKGEIASATVCKQIGEVLSSHKSTDDFDDDDFRYVINQAYNALDKVSDESNKGMGTTLTFLSFHSKGAFAAHIGDSRIYQIRPTEGIIYRSEDHSLVNALLRSGNISPDEVYNHPKNNVITRCMGANDGTRDIDDATVVNLTDIAPGDYFLLCTDGVTGKVGEESLVELYSSNKTAQGIYKELADRCKDSSDNNTAIQIHIGLVTIDPDEVFEEQTFDCENINTQKLSLKDSSVHDISGLPNNKYYKLKSFFNRLFS